MRASIVVGLGFGDEGKGVVTSSLVKDSNNPLVIRFNGGHQAGHTVVKDGYRHVFSSFGSGTLHGAPSYWSSYCTVYPTALMNEYQILKPFKPILYIDPMCPITTPFDIRYNQGNNKHGSVGVGFGATIQRQKDHYTLFAKDLKYPSVLLTKLKQISRYYNDFCNVDSFIEDVHAMLMVVEIGKPSLKRDLVFEGAQGILLDQWFGFFPHVTRSNTTSKNALTLFDSSKYDSRVLLVTRTYQTRHGKGPMTNEGKRIELFNNENETNVYNEPQGHFRTSPLDNDLINYAVECDDSVCNLKKSIIMTCCDQVEQVPDINVKYPLIYNDSPEGNFVSYDFRKLVF